MSAEQDHHAVRGWRWLAAVSAMTGAAVFGALPAMPAAAHAVTTAATPGEQIAAALRTSPVYVDPSLSSAFPPAVRESLLRQIRKAPAPVFILAIPLVSGGEWATGEQLATVVQNDLGRAGIYLMLDADFSSDVDAFTWPSDPQGIDAPPYHAAAAAEAVNISQDMQNATLPQKLIRCIELISDGQAVSADAAAQRQLDQNTPPPAAASGQPSGGGPGGLIIAVIVIAVLGAGAGGWLLVRRRGRRPSPFITPHSVFAAARTATESQLRSLAQQQVIELGELAEQPGPLAAAGADGPQSEQAREQVARTLDAYQAAGKVLDSASGMGDLWAATGYGQFGNDLIQRILTTGAHPAR